MAISLLTVLPVRAGRVDRAIAGRAMALAPVAGLVVGAAAAVPLAAGGTLGPAAPLRAVLAVAVIAVLTRALHLDGLADLADGLGSGRDATPALEIMKRSDIGPFGVVTLIFVLAIQVTALTEAAHASATVIIATMTGRLAITWACRAGVPAARPDGLGALVAGSVRPRAAAAATAAVLAVAAGLGGLFGGAGAALAAGSAVAAGLAAAEALRRHAQRRLGGVTGDVLGALVETATTAALLVLAALS
ncbi:adenosylcobinamide-GDP ribazoletransferase [Actinomadura craniellae]|uniref:Adenosylcobinamide-GDP ribazoletransferase n=1 Tax=Actinomadura craniellae TaxID=2231787 RepID=A0A365H2D1_9ACTN|nr:adenosylcobinamide-GDP ribazoletransferase [Actinomadura craniellae]